jgi:release factor glutamine methyltransferase
MLQELTFKIFPEIPVSTKLVILSSILDLPIPQILTYSKTLKDTDLQLFKSKCELFLSNKPLAYITNSVSFYHLDLYIDENVLIPRVETENLVDIVLKDVVGVKKILEIGVGSGCISLSLSKNLQKNTKLIGIDISKNALKVCEKNMFKNNVENLILIHTDIKNLNTTELFDLIISNPPYINTKQIRYLQKSVKSEEPLIALDGGVDGIDIIRDILNFSKTHLNKNGRIYIEINSQRQYLLLKKEFKGVYKHFKLINDQYSRGRYILAQI